MSFGEIAAGNIYTKSTSILLLVPTYHLLLLTKYLKDHPEVFAHLSLGDESGSVL